MNEIDNLLGILEDTDAPKSEVVLEDTSAASPEQAKAEPVTEPVKGGKVDLWQAHIAPVAVDKETLLRFNRMFTVVTHGEVPGEISLLIEQISKLLLTKGFTFRYDGNNKDTASTKAYQTCKSRCEIYLPWKGFNKDVTAKLNKPSEKAYGYASGFHGGFNKIPSSVRAIVAHNVHVLLGDECNTPVNLFITYTTDGAEVKADVKYETTGPVSFFITACDALDIPVFNLKNPTAKERIVEFLNTLK